MFQNSQHGLAGCPTFVGRFRLSGGPVTPCQTIAGDRKIRTHSTEIWISTLGGHRTPYTIHSVSDFPACVAAIPVRYSPDSDSLMDIPDEYSGEVMMAWLFRWFFRRIWSRSPPLPVCPARRQNRHYLILHPTRFALTLLESREQPGNMLNGILAGLAGMPSLDPLLSLEAAVGEQALSQSPPLLSG